MRTTISRLALAVLFSCLLPAARLVLLLEGIDRVGADPPECDADGLRYFEDGEMKRPGGMNPAGLCD